MDVLSSYEQLVYVVSNVACLQFYTHTTDNIWPYAIMIDHNMVSNSTLFFSFIPTTVTNLCCFKCVVLNVLSSSDCLYNFFANENL